MWLDAIALLIVLLAAGYALRALLPQPARAWLRQTLGRKEHGAGAAGGDACGGCSGCDRNRPGGCH